MKAVKGGLHHRYKLFASESSILTTRLSRLRDPVQSNFSRY
jgi:hypothetical protein